MMKDVTKYSTDNNPVYEKFCLQRKIGCVMM